MADAPDYGSLFQTAGQIHDIDPLLLQAIQQTENPSGDPKAVGSPNRSGELARGVMQFLPSTAAQYGVNPEDPASSILGAGQYLAKLRKDTGDNLPQMLALYGGGPGATAYAGKVLDTYHQLQRSWGVGGQSDDSGDTGTSFTYNAPAGGATPSLPGAGETPREQAFAADQAAQPPQRNVHPPASAPAYFGGSDQPGARAQHALPASDTTTTPPTDFTGALFGPAKPAAPPPTTAAEPPPAGDFPTQLFGPAPAAPSAASSETPPATPLTTPPAPSWWQTNVAEPAAAMYDPTKGEPMQYMLGQPFLQNLGAGIMEGTRDTARRLNEWGQQADQAYPALAAIDRSAVASPTAKALSDLPVIGNALVPQTPEQLAATGQRLAAEDAAYQQRYGDSGWATAGRIGGNLLSTYPLGVLAWGARGLAAALPWLRGTTEVASAAGVPAAQNVLTTPGQDPGTAAAQGALGGLAVHGALGSVGGQFARGALTQAQQDAQRLGFNLTTGELSGGLAKNLEDVTQYLPLSGAGAKAAEHRGVINGVLNENMGMPNSPVLTQATMQTARANAQQLMNQIQNVTVDANRDPNLLNELSQIHAEASAQPMTGSSITGAVDNVLNTAANNGGQLPGDILHNLIKSGTPLDRLTQSPDPVIRQFAQRIETSLQDAASRTGDPAIYGAQQAAQNAQAVDALNRGRYYWKTIKTVEPLVDKTGTADDVGYAGLARRIEGTPANPNFDPRFAGGNNDMAALARVLRGPLAELKSSGTGRQLITANLLGLGGEGGLGAATAIFRPENFGTYLSTVVAPTLATIGAGRLSRYGPTMGNPALEAASRTFNPLMPRVAGPAVGSNLPVNPLLNYQSQSP